MSPFFVHLYWLAADILSKIKANILKDKAVYDIPYSIQPIEDLWYQEIFARTSGWGSSTLGFGHTVTISNTLEWQSGSNFGASLGGLSGSILSSTGINHTASTMISLASTYTVPLGQLYEYQAIAQYQGVRFNVILHPSDRASYIGATAIVWRYHRMHFNPVRLQ